MLGLTPFHLCIILTSADSGMFTISPFSFQQAISVISMKVEAGIILRLTFRSQKRDKVLGAFLSDGEW
jgi:hypothetical protein